MGTFYTKWRRAFLGFTIANVLIVVIQLAFAYGHWSKHEWWGLSLSLFFGTVNAVCAVHQYRQWQRIKQEEKDFMWTTLQSPSEAFR